MSVAASHSEYDLKRASSKNKLLGLWRLMTGFRLKYLGASLFLGISALAKTYTYLLLRYFIDNHLSPGAAPSLSTAWIALGFVLLALIEGGFSFLSGRLAAQTAEGIARRVRNYLFDHIQHLSFTYHSKMETGELIQRSTSDVDAVRRFYSEQAIGMGRIILLFTINFTTIFQLNTQLALFSILVIPLILAVSIFFFRRISKVYTAYQEQEAVLSTTLQENLAGVRVVKAFARQDYEMKKFDDENWKKFRQGKRLATMHSFFWPITDLVCAAQLITGYLIASLMVLNKDITLGTYMAYVGVLGWIIWPMRNLGRLIVQTSTGLISFGRVMDIVKEDREPLDQGDYLPPTHINGEVIFEHIGFVYQEGNAALEDINLTVKPGQVVALLGSTGSGKTTLVNLLPRFYNYTQGHIWLDGVELNRYPRRFLRRQIGIVEQEPFLFSRSIRENITYGVGRDISQEEIEKAARAAAIHDVIISFPEGYETLVGEKGVTLSGGQKQRVAIARTLLKNPRLLILDDSTSSVDTETEAEIRQALQGLMQDRTTFIIAHRIQSIMDADLILVMDQGKIVQAGKHADLLNQDGMYRKIYEIQTRIENELEKEIANA